MHLNTREVRAYKASMLERRKRQAQQKKCEEKERVAYKASVLDRRKRQAQQKNYEAKKGVQHEDFPGGQPS